VFGTALGTQLGAGRTARSPHSSGPGEDAADYGGKVIVWIPVGWGLAEATRLSGQTCAGVRTV
jgi:hypothetical protein